MITNWWDDPKFNRPLVTDERRESVTDQAGVAFTPGNWCICVQCGKDFKSKRRTYGTKYCSSKCRQKAYRLSKKQEQA